MKFKYIILVSLILAILTLSAVSASQDDISLAVAEQTQDSLSIDENLVDDSSESLSGENTQEIIGDDEREEVDDYWGYAPSSAAMNSTNKIYMYIEADDPTGNFTFSLNNQIFYNAPIEWNEQYEDYRHTMYLNELDLQPGINNLTLQYTGDDNYKPVTMNFKIDAYYFKAFITPKNVKIYGNYSTWWTVEAGDQTGYACVLIDDEVYMNDTIANLMRDYGTSNYTFRIYFLNCTYGDHTYTVRYYNGKYEDITYTGEFNIDYYFELSYYTNIIYPEPVTFRYSLPNDVTEDVIITINDKNYTVHVENGEGRFIYNYTELEDLNVIAIFKNEKYPERVRTETVEIEAKIKMESSAYYDSKNVISLTLPADASGNLTVYKRAEDKTKGDMIATKALVDGKVSFDADILDMGVNYLLFEYTGTDYPVTIYTYNQITIYPNVTYPKKVNKEYKNYITALFSDNCTGNFTIELYDEEWETLLMTLYDGPAKEEISVEIPDLESGTYIFVWTYNYEKQPFPLSQGNYLYVGASDYNWTMDVDFPEQIGKENIYFGSDGYFTIHNIPEDIEGWIVLYVDGEKIEEYEAIDYIEEGWNTMYFSIYSLSLGNHTYQVKLTDSSYYVAQPVNGTFELIPYVFPETIEYNGQDYSLYFDLDNKSANSILSILIDGEDYKMVQLKEGKAEIKLTDIPLGNHTYELICTGDVNASYTGNFDVKMAFRNLKDYLLYYYGELVDVELGLPSYAEGVVTLTANDKNYTSKVENGTAKFDLSKLELGKYLINVKYSGDDINPAQEFDFNLTISRYNIKPEYVDDYYEFLGYSIILPSNATGNLNIYNKSTLLKSIPLVDGKAFFKVDELDFGTYDLVVRYESKNYDYNVSERTRSYVNTPPVNITDAYVGGDARIYIDLRNATGIITVNLNQEEYANVTIQDGKINMSIPYQDLLSSHEYFFTVSFVYHGNDFDPSAFDYGGSPRVYMGYIQSYTINIPKIIANGEPAYVSVELPSNSEGYAVLRIYGDSIYSIYNMTFSNVEEIVLPIPILPAGEYWVDLSYYNAYYDRHSSASKYVTVLKPEPTLDIIAPTDTKVPVLIFNISKDATGNIIVNIAGKDHGLYLVNGSANITLPGLDNGDYNVSVTYSGDDYYNDFTKIVNVTIDADQYEPKVVASDLTMVYTAGNLYKATVWGANGKLASNVEVTFLINGKVFKTVKTDSKGVASVKLTQVPGTYKITAKSLEKSVTKKLTVKHVVTLKKVTVKRSAKKLVLTATLSKVNGKYLKNKKITFKFKGKKYTAKTNAKGIAKVTIKKAVLKKLKAGKKVTYQATYLKDTVKKTVKVKK